MNKYITSLCLALAMLLVSCVSDESYCGQDTMTMFFDGSIASYDDINSRAAVTIADGTKLYIHFDNNVNGTAVYHKAENAWSLSCNGTLKSGNCRVYYVENPGAVTDSQINLDANSVVYGTLRGSYEMSGDGNITVKADLKPRLSRVRFKGDTGISFTVGGLKKATSLSLNDLSYGYSTSATQMQIKESGYSEYIYFDESEDALAITIGSKKYTISHNMEDAIGSYFLNLPAVELDEIVDAEIDYSKISEIPQFSWGGSESAFSRLSLKNGCLHFHSTEAVDPSWDCQFFPIGGIEAEVGVTYTLHYKIKGSVAQNVSMLGFGQTPWGEFPITTEWVEGTVDYYCTEPEGNILMQCGDYVGDWDIAYLKITHKENERPIEWTELITNGDAEHFWRHYGLSGIKYNDSDNNYKICFWAKEKGHKDDVPFPGEIVTESDGNHAFVCHAQYASSGDESAAWDNQIWLQSPRQWNTGDKFKLSFRYKASRAVKASTEVHGKTPSEYVFWQAIGDIDFSVQWQTFEKVVSVSADLNGMWSVAFNLNTYDKKSADFYIDDISWSEVKK